MIIFDYNDDDDDDGMIGCNYYCINISVQQWSWCHISSQALEDEMADQDTKLEELKVQLEESKNKGLLHDDEEQQILDKMKKLEITMNRVNTAHDENKKR